MDVFRKQPIAITVAQGVDEELARFLPSTKPPPGVDQPEPAGEEGCLGHAKIIAVGITHHVLPAQQVPLNCGNSADEARVVRLDQANLRKEQNARIELLDAEPGGKGFTLLAPCPLEQSGLHGGSNLRPLGGSILETEMGGDRGETAATGPAHRGRISMNVRPAAIFPDASVGLEGQLRRLQP